MLFFFSDWSDSTKAATVEVTVRDIARAAESVRSFGPGRRQTLTIRVPPDVIHAHAQDHRVVYRMLMSTGLATDIVEATDAPLRGNLPRKEGLHSITLEYRDSGVVTIDGCLSMHPPQTSLILSPGEGHNLSLILYNGCDENITSVSIRIEGPAEDRLSVNVTSLSLPAGQERPISVTVTIPEGSPPSLTTSYVIAEGDPDYADSTITIKVNASICGDGILSAAEECETRSPFRFPDEQSLHCPLESGFACEAGRYLMASEFGACLAGCVCETEQAQWKACGTGCTDPLYCGLCDHCEDDIRNCGETSPDAGPACPSCDGVDDMAEGFVCDLGDTMACGGTGCAGTRRCVLDGGACAWTDCSSYGDACIDICCLCGGDPLDPQRILDTSPETSISSCMGTSSICKDPFSCTGKRYGTECTAIGVCGPDLDESLHQAQDDPLACLGESCGPSELACHDQSYPCHGIRTEARCDAQPSCQTLTSQDDTVCDGIEACEAPEEIILHKLDLNSREYVDAPSSFWGYMGGFYLGTCETDSGYHTFRGLHMPDEGAYAPYENGTLNFYAKADWRVDDNSHAIFDCTFPCGCDVRLGTDEDNWMEWKVPCPATKHWTKLTKDLTEAPTNTSGTIDWDHLDYLRFRFGAHMHICTHCSPCFGNVDYVTLKR